MKNVSEVLEKTRENAKTAVNLSMVYAYYEIGRMIVEEEQHGENRAAYGKQTVELPRWEIRKGLFNNELEAYAN